MNNLPSEVHPLAPFLPDGARVLMLGSFPPKRTRWSMEFFYPNLQNDMWRIMGLIFFNEKSHFLADSKHFDRERIMAFCRTAGLALYDTASEVVRLRDNASDNFLQVVRPTDVRGLLGQLPLCRAVVTTGEKATETLVEQLSCERPAVGASTPFEYAGRTMRLYRMPSSSRAYPRPVEWKAEFYRKMFEEVGMI
ncbi:uracil-DNA glycosylase family protein [Alistipes sp.]|uniref:uracil-DNA glycosylase family protein n=1 Tax=Alistipes sp. TaxID=1872444 RepID=UPI003A857224